METAAKDHGLWIFDLAHGNLQDPEVLQGFIRYYVLEGKSLNKAMDQLKAVLRKAAEGRC